MGRARVEKRPSASGSRGEQAPQIKSWFLKRLQTGMRASLTPLPLGGWRPPLLPLSPPKGCQQQADLGRAAAPCVPTTLSLQLRPTPHRTWGQVLTGCHVVQDPARTEAKQAQGRGPAAVSLPCPARGGPGRDIPHPLPGPRTMTILIPRGRGRDQTESERVKGSEDSRGQGPSRGVLSHSGGHLPTLHLCPAVGRRAPRRGGAPSAHTKVSASLKEALDPSNHRLPFPDLDPLREI